MFHAGVHNNPTYYRQIKGTDGIVRDDPFGRFLPMDPEKPAGTTDRMTYDNRAGYAGNTVNEWVDEYNGFHFYILQKNDYGGKYGTFLSYDVAVRNTLPNAWKGDGELILTEAAPIIPAVVGNFAKQTYTLTNTGTETDIVRITLGGALAENAGLAVATKDQEAVILNNLFAVGAGETIEFDVFVKTVDGFANSFDLTVTATSETNPEKADDAGVTVVIGATPTAYVVRNNGNTNNLFVTVVENYANGGSFVFEKAFVISNNAEGIYEVGAYKVFVDTKGNTQIRNIYITEFGLTADRSIVEGEVVLVAVTTNARDIRITGSNIWTVNFKVTEAYSNGDTVVVDHAVTINRNSSGRIDLGLYTLIYDIAGNGSNIKVFNVILK